RRCRSACFGSPPHLACRLGMLLTPLLHAASGAEPRAAGFFQFGGTGQLLATVPAVAQSQGLGLKERDKHGLPEFTQTLESTTGGIPARELQAEARLGNPVGQEDVASLA